MRYYAALVVPTTKEDRSYPRIWRGMTRWKTREQALAEAERAKAALLPVVVNANRQGTGCYPGLALDSATFEGMIGTWGDHQLSSAPAGSLDDPDVRVAWKWRAQRQGATGFRVALALAYALAKSACPRAVSS